MTEQALHILLIDNYDSFSYNLVELLRNVDNVKVFVLKNDDLSIFRDEYDGVIISPGPGLPGESAFLLEAIDFYTGKIPILGICLGLQAIYIHQGGKLQQLKKVYHGIKDLMYREENQPAVLLDSVPEEFHAGRYHSWVADETTLPSDITITARDEENLIMAIEDTAQNIYAVQFHPESYMTEIGIKIVQNFIDLTLKLQGNRISEIKSKEDSFLQ